MTEIGSGLSFFTEVVNGNTDSPEIFLKLFERVTKLAWYELGAPGVSLLPQKGGLPEHDVNREDSRRERQG